MSKTAEEILRQLVKERCPDNLKPYTDEDFKRWMDDDKKDGEVIIQAMSEFAAQEVEEYKDRLKSLISQQVASNQSSHLLTESQIHGLIDMLK